MSSAPLPALPAARGPLSAHVLAHLGRGPVEPLARRRRAVADPFDDDLQLALYLAYEQHFGPVADVDREWDPALLATRAVLESWFTDGLQRVVGRARAGGSVTDVIRRMVAEDDGPSLSSHLEQHGTLDQFRDVVRHRSAYQLKEADGHTMGIPRLRGRAKQLLARIQSGEYGADAPDREVHATLFAQTMRSLGLDPRPNALLDELPGTALGISNVISMFGLHRRWRGALVGHLAVFEMTSVVPMGRYGRALERLGAPAEARRFYDVHVLADAEHELEALELAALVVDAEPQLRDDVLFGAACAIEADRRFAAGLFGRWGVEAAVAA